MLSARYLLLHQALDLGPMWLNNKARLTPPSQTPEKQNSTLEIKQTLSASLLIKEETSPIAVTSKTSDISKKTKQSNKTIETSGKNLEMLAQEVLTCQACNLSACRKQPLFSRGNPSAELFILSMNPTPEDDLASELFYGKAGELLSKMLKAIDIDINETYLTSMVKCAPTFGEEIQLGQFRACQTLVDAQIDLIKPKAVLALGTDLTSLVEGGGEGDLYKGIPFFLTPHPARLMRHTQEKAQAWETLKNLRDFLQK